MYGGTIRAPLILNFCARWIQLVAFTLRFLHPWCTFHALLSINCTCSLGGTFCKRFRGSRKDQLIRTWVGRVIDYMAPDQQVEPEDRVTMSTLQSGCPLWSTRVHYLVSFACLNDSPAKRTLRSSAILRRVGCRWRHYDTPKRPFCLPLDKP